MRRPYHSGSLCSRCELESSGSLSSALNPRGTFKPLYDRIVDLAEMHVESREIL